MEPEELLAIHPGIRWVGLATRKGDVIFAQMRNGVTSLTHKTNDLSVLEVRTQYIIESADRKSRWSGALDRIAFWFERYAELVVPFKESYILVTLEKDVPPGTFPKTSKAIRELE